MGFDAATMAMRAQGVGASEIAAVVDPEWDGYRGPLAVWAEKVAGKNEENELMRLGKAAEPIIVNLYARHTGSQVRRNSKTIWHPKHKHIFATPDARVLNQRLGVECKNRVVFVAHKYGDDYYPNHPMAALPVADKVQTSEMCQAQMCMEVTGLKEWHLAVWFGGADFRIYRITYDAKLTGRLIEVAREFMERYVIPKVEPPADWTDWCKNYLDEKHPDVKEPLLESNEIWDGMMARYRMCAKNEKAWGHQKDDARNKMLQMLGDAEGVKGLFTYRMVQANPKFKEILTTMGVEQAVIDASRGPAFRKFNPVKGE
jgi:hypothetical protein